MYTLYKIKLNFSIVITTGMRQLRYIRLMVPLRALQPVIVMQERVRIHTA